MSSIVNKIKDAVHGDKHHDNTSEGSHGPHASRAANAADPRVDSDLDNSRTMGGAGRTAGHGEYGVGQTYGATQGTAEGVHGPHGSRLANAADPRVDSDLDNSRTMGTTGRTAGHGEYGVGQTYGSTQGTAEGVHGPHSSRLANTVDPRVDSDRDGSRTMGNTTGGTGTTGAGYGNQYSTTGTGGTGFAGTGSTGFTGTGGQVPEGTHGHHNNRVLNAADPRIDSDRDGRAAFGGTGPGPAANTAGPHQSDMMNKMDPRVDSDLDGSKTLGNNRTYQ